MNKPKMYRQGDILIERVAKKPASKTKRQSDAILAHGEVTGHSHAIEEPPVAKLADVAEPWTIESDLSDSGPMTRKFMALTKDSAVVHQEHARIPLERGKYRVTRQREYSPEAIRNVAD